MSTIAFPAFVHMVVGYIIILSKPPNDKERSLLHLLAPILGINNTHGIQH